MARLDRSQTTIAPSHTGILREYRGKIAKTSSGEVLRLKWNCFHTACKKSARRGKALQHKAIVQFLTHL